MSAKSLILVRRVKTDAGWKRYPAAFAKNGRPRPDYVQVGDEQVCYLEGTYEVRRYIDRKTVYTPLGEKAGEAWAKVQQMSRKEAAKALAADAGLIATDPTEAKKTLREIADEFVADAVHRGADEAALKNRQHADEFLAVCAKQYPQQVGKSDIYAYISARKKAGNEDRTIAGKVTRIYALLRYAGIDVKNTLPPLPKYEKKLPTVYTSDHAGAILKAGDHRFQLMMQVGLMLGLRLQEIAHMYHSDIDQRGKVLRVRSKPEWKFKVKDSEERDVTIPSDLLLDLNAWHHKDPNTRLMFPTKYGKPDTKILRTLKRAANKAKLNCGHCEGCKAKHRECREWTVHRFRRSYMTTMLREGVDIRTVQALAGHADLTSTLRYLRPAAASELHSKLDAIRWTS